MIKAYLVINMLMDLVLILMFMAIIHRVYMLIVIEEVLSKQQKILIKIYMHTKHEAMILIYIVIMTT